MADLSKLESGHGLLYTHHEKVGENGDGGYCENCGRFEEEEEQGQKCR